METLQEIAHTPAKELPACPVETTLTLISDKWKVLILRDLLPGTRRCSPPSCGRWSRAAC